MKPAVDEVVERELVQRHRDARRVADDVAEARARDTRRPLHVEAADLRVLAGGVESGRLAHAPQLLGVVLRVAVRRRVVGWVRHERERGVARGLGRGELLLGLLERGLDGPQRLELLRRRLALELRLPAKLVDARDECAPALVGVEQRVELLGRALARERRAPAVGSPRVRPSGRSRRGV